MGGGATLAGANVGAGVGAGVGGGVAGGAVVGVTVVVGAVVVGPAAAGLASIKPASTKDAAAIETTKCARPPRPPDRVRRDGDVARGLGGTKRIRIDASP